LELQHLEEERRRRRREVLKMRYPFGLVSIYYALYNSPPLFASVDFVSAWAVEWVTDSFQVVAMQAV
jgi:hypothetical protein